MEVESEVAAGKGQVKHMCAMGEDCLVDKLNHVMRSSGRGAMLLPEEGGGGVGGIVS